MFRLSALYVRTGILVSLFAFGLSQSALLAQEVTRFAALGDFGFAKSETRKVAQQIKDWDPDFIISLGDNNYPDGADSTIDLNIGSMYAEFIGDYQGEYGTGSEENRFFPTLGNHDWKSMDCDAAGCHGAYLDYFTLPGNERYYDFVAGPVHFFAIDSDRQEPHGNTVDSKQATWLREGLQESTSPWKIVFFHHPPYSSSTNGSSPNMRWPFREWGASVVITGHDHVYQRFEWQGFPYILNGLGGYTRYGFDHRLEGSQVRFNREHGALFFTATDETLMGEFVSLDGEVVDMFSVPPPNNEGLINWMQLDQTLDQLKMVWKTFSRIPAAEFSLQMSFDGNSFYDVATIETPSGNGPYVTWTEIESMKDAFYRLRWLDSEDANIYTEAFPFRPESDATWANFKLEQVGEGFVAEWETTGEFHIDHMQIRTSVRGETAAVGATNVTTSYELSVQGLRAGQHSARVFAIGQDGIENSSPRIEYFLNTVADIEDLRADLVRDSVIVAWNSADAYVLGYTVVANPGTESERDIETIVPKNSTPQVFPYRSAVEYSADIETIGLRWLTADSLLGSFGPVDLILGTQREVDALADVISEVYPNPSQGRVTLTYEFSRSQGSVNVSIFDVRGRLVYERPSVPISPGRGQIQIDLGDDIATPGLHFVRIKTGAGDVFSRPVMILSGNRD